MKMARKGSKCSKFHIFSKKRHVFQSKKGLVFDSKTCLFSLTKSCIPSYFWLWVSFFETQSGFKVVSNSLFLKPKVVFFFFWLAWVVFFFCSLVSRSEKSCFLAKIHHKLGFKGSKGSKNVECYYYYHGFRGYKWLKGFEGFEGFGCFECFTGTKYSEF